MILTPLKSLSLSLPQFQTYINQSGNQSTGEALSIIATVFAAGMIAVSRFAVPESPVLSAPPPAAPAPSEVPHKELEAV